MRSGNPAGRRWANRPAKWRLQRRLANPAELALYTLLVSGGLLFNGFGLGWQVVRWGAGGSHRGGGDPRAGAAHPVLGEPSQPAGREPAAVPRLERTRPRTHAGGDPHERRLAPLHRLEWRRRRRLRALDASPPRGAAGAAGHGPRVAAQRGAAACLRRSASQRFRGASRPPPQERRPRSRAARCFSKTAARPCLALISTAARCRASIAAAARASPRACSAATSARSRWTPATASSRPPTTSATRSPSSRRRT